MSRERAAWVQPVSIVVALLLGLMPLTEAIAPLRPYWLALAVAFWVLEEPERAGLGFAFFVGLIADFAFGSLLGEQALRLTILAFILQRFRARLRFVPLSQQSLAIGALLLNDRIVTTALHFALGEPMPAPLSWIAPAIGMVLWAPLFWLFDVLRLKAWRHR
jgi:rod shape-determining protein MreD